MGDHVSLPDRNGKPRKMTRRDLLAILLKVPRGPDGLYCGTASLKLPGKVVGPPRYSGTRTDDLKRYGARERRRDRPGLHVIDAWLARDDSPAINNPDAVVTEDGRTFVRHYQPDFSSTLDGTCEQPESRGHYFDWSGSATQFFILGLAPPYWAFANFSSVGKFEWQVFDPERWVPEYPNPAFLNRLPRVTDSD